jgi:hypothetical protein
MSKSRFSVMAAALLLSVTAAAATAQRMFADVSGKWSFTAETPNGATTSLLTAKQTGDSLSGTLDIEQMGSRPVAGVVKGDTVRFWFSVDIGGQMLDIRGQGLLTDADNMAGQLELAGMGTFPFTAKKQK